VRKSERGDQLARYEQSIYAMRWITAEVFLRHRLDDLSYHEIAARFGIGVDEVEKHIAEALYTIARALDD
jgi:RNA polymerase sigma-70 factor (ECF subfamily)